ncbi:hypothetical protein NLG97_g10197 [Lecanicillium saksenae]|uniref:Uncharacterized protein n=1 Tax=Lecanicillium saksenae TaxID=468837 RepID=A0ACC1QFJ5_9HYPO|nr:hypothetical protein NLG97_g10197 [Lecanicillium saksenae]
MTEFKPERPESASIQAILEHYEYDPSQVERIAFSKVHYPLEIVEPNPKWPAHFASVKVQIEAALGAELVSVEHVGSTSVAGLPAKDFIDIDVTVRDISDEASYAAALEAAGFHFLTRERRWHNHRLFCLYEPHAATLHIWGPGSPEAARHIIFRDWLRAHAEERALYAQVKRESAEQSNQVGESSMGYNRRKEKVVREILERAFTALGYIQEQPGQADADNNA